MNEKEQNIRMREWFEKRTGLKNVCLSVHMKKIDKMLFHWYPESFIEWIGENEYYFDRDNNNWIVSVEPEVKRITTAKLYKHFLKNLKK